MEDFLLTVNRSRCTGAVFVDLTKGQCMKVPLSSSFRSSGLSFRFFFFSFLFSPMNCRPDGIYCTVSWLSDTLSNFNVFNPRRAYKLEPHPAYRDLQVYICTPATPSVTSLSN